MALAPDKRPEIFASFADSAITNSHNAIKTVWVVLFSAGTFNLLKSFNELAQCAKYVDTKDHFERGFCHGFLANVHSIHFVMLCLYYIAYIMTFYRFYVGNIRMFDVRYIEQVKFIEALAKNEDDKEAKKEVYKRLFLQVDKNSRGENIYLLFVTLVVVSLTLYLNTPKVFIEIYMALLLLDLVWMLWVLSPKAWIGMMKYIYSKKVEQDTKLVSFRDHFFSELGFDFAAPSEEQRKATKIIGSMFPDNAKNIWAWNNAVFFVLLFICFESRLAITRDRFYWFGIALILFNSLVDILAAWSFYNPRFAKAYQLTCGSTVRPNPQTT